MVVTDSDGLRVAVIGAGPSGFYVAEQLFKEVTASVSVDIYDRLPTPWGLVRSGVAPDHPAIKSVSRVFEKTAADPRFRFYGNVEFGVDLTRADLALHYDAVVYAVGAQADRRLGIPGEDLPGSYAAVDFVAWYNGHPDHPDRQFDLSGKRAVLIGNGNVSIDVARILSSDLATLGGTDIADHALTALRDSAIRQVVVCGRRGPEQAAFTTPELRELGGLPGVRVVAHQQDVGSPTDENPNSSLEILRRHAAEPGEARPREIEFRFLLSPVEVRGAGRVEEVVFDVNELVYDGEAARVKPTGKREVVPCDLLIRSIGYRGVPLPGVPFDESTGRIPNDAGRVLRSGRPAAGEYCTGWVKRGPSGVIGTNRKCATETVGALLADYVEGVFARPANLPREAVDELFDGRGITVVDQAGWLRIDSHERSLGAQASRPRVKLCRYEGLLAQAGVVPDVNHAKRIR
ncbi:FAD-dependent oxidoreductase [Streptomyces lanatus]|uniref:ferredoxin--NADP(+) reductase n=1 Tax=Streptomyces lanatus TaxID=66900 RepID=A0ABV1Y5Y1_9ACTN|nr:FAD-dependent oxidoreductase [Streptomyces lanatus]GHH30358.1 NADP oxidoreductase [Streptomyces lanatus]